MATRIRLTRKTLFVAVPLFILLATAAAFSFHVWTQIGGDVGMNGNGVAALVIGAGGSLILGGGLMALVFFSSRRGYDDAADLKRPDDGR
jgi:hypothetical protein